MSFCSSGKRESLATDLMPAVSLCTNRSSAIIWTSTATGLPTWLADMVSMFVISRRFSPAPGCSRPQAVLSTWAICCSASAVRNRISRLQPSEDQANGWAVVPSLKPPNCLGLLLSGDSLSCRRVAFGMNPRRARRREQGVCAQQHWPHHLHRNVERCFFCIRCRRGMRSGSA